MKAKLNITAILTIIIFTVAIIMSSLRADNRTNDVYVTTASSVDEIGISEKEMRGLWVSYLSLYMEDGERDFENFKKKFDKITETAKKLKCNTLFVQIRPFCDALYKSDIYPHSHILSGKQGLDPGYDALEYMCESAHNEGLEIHGWINPYRVKNTSTLTELSSDNPAISEDGLTLNLESGIYLNPAKKSVRSLIVKGISEIIEKYQIDGIQFDDYFYPADIGNSDGESYNSYIKSLQSNSIPMTLEEWRTNNVNLLIAEVYKTVKDINKDIIFGISPQANIKNNNAIYADVKRWCDTYGYVDYICPQMYFSLDNPSFKFEEALIEWKKLTYHNNIKIYAGLGVYKAGSNEDDGTWLQRNDILAKELRLLREYDYDGYILYDYKSVLSEKAQNELNNFLRVIDDNA